MISPLDVGVPLRAGYIATPEADGRTTCAAVVEQVPSSTPAARFISQFECALSLTDAMARAASMCDRFANCTYQGDLTGASA